MKKFKFCTLLIIAVGMIGLRTFAASPQTIYNSPYVTFSPDGKAWTTNAGDKDYTWYEVGTTVSTGINSSLRELNTGEHYYQYKRTGTIPIGYWKVAYRTGTCIHNAYPEEDTSWHDIDYARKPCGAYYYSGWNVYCADCGERISDMFMYMSREAAVSIDYMEVGNGMAYYYLCPHSNNLEQGAKILEHKCNAISWNQYKVRYDVNTIAKYGGYMADSIHMYNNATEFEGEPVTPVTHLTKNAFTRIGYEFVEWNTKPDGSGISYQDGQEILNLTSENREEGVKGKGVVTLYAQWRPSKSTLQINANGGTYNGKSYITSVTGQYLSSYTVNNNSVTAPRGYTVFFETNGGNPVASITGTRHFTEWSMEQPFKGDFYNSVYLFVAPDGSVDTITANYAHDPITLPSASKSGSSFGGWYYDPEFKEPAGGPGDTIIPDGNLTLYAQWIDLKLYSKDNYTANDGKGAVDLSWTQSDGRNKNYMIYQSRDNRNWTQVNGAEDISSSHSVSEKYAYTGSQGTYTVPYTGLYTITADGAQGGDYGDCQGGLGGQVSAKVWLTAGETVTYNVGGRNGYNGGGSADMFANGGGCTVVSTDRKGTILIAGGGGGASSMGNGGAGGSAASLVSTGIKGQDGGAGGGGGYLGGSAGELVVHHHTEECYHSDDLSYILLDKTNDYVNPWMSAYWNTGNAACDYWGGSSKRINIYGSYGHSGSDKEDRSTAFYHLGMVYDRNASSWWYAYKAPDFSPEYIPTNGNTNLQFSVIYHEWGEGAGYNPEESYIKVYDQDDNLIFSKTAAEMEQQKEDGSYDQNHEAWEDEDGEWSGSPDVTHRVYAYNVRLPEGTEGIYFKTVFCNTANDEAFKWVDLYYSKVYFSGGKNTFLTCGMEEGQVLSSKPAYGGSSYINTAYTGSYTDTPGVRRGDGQVSIKSESIGFLDVLKLDGVTATDYAAPDKVSDSSVTKEAVTNTQVKVSWEAPKDNGTVYYHVAESYLTGSTAPLCRSNTTRNVLTSGIEGYYCLLDENSGTMVTAQNSTFTKDACQVVTMGRNIQYLHVAAVDKAGNIGAAAHIRLDASVQDISWKLYTRQLAIEDGDNVYPAEQDRSYYVRSDGTTPFTLEYQAYMDGVANMQYQINYAVFESQASGETFRNILYCRNNQLQEESFPVGTKEVSFSTTLTSGKPLLAFYPLTTVIRSNSNRDVSASQAFTLDQDADGKKITLVPAAGADYQGKVVYSDYDKDKQNSLVIIGDGQAPVIQGLDVLENLELINRNDGEISLRVTARDALSGVKDFYLEIYNHDNTIRKIYRPDEDGSIRIDITGEEPIFSGDITVTAYAVDYVGNENTLSYGTTEFSLQTSIKRILEPHDPIFQCGESGILTVTSWGYADRVEVEFPEEMLKLNPELNKIYVYTDTPQYCQEETLQFMIPLYTPSNQNFTITVRAYKGGKKLEDYPALSIIQMDGSILDDTRTRLR